jgi:hypothetical protein
MVDTQKQLESLLDSFKMYSDDRCKSEVVAFHNQMLNEIGNSSSYPGACGVVHNGTGFWNVCISQEHRGEVLLVDPMDKICFRATADNSSSIKIWI